MRAYLIFLTPVLLMTFLITGTVQAQSGTPAASNPIAGTWKLSSGAFAGQEMPKEQLDGMQLAIRNDAYEMKAPGMLETGKLVFGAVEEGKPQTLDIVSESGPNKDKTVLAIFQVDGDKLTVCYSMEKKRPTEFASDRDNPTLLLHYERSK